MAVLVHERADVARGDALVRLARAGDREAFDRLVRDRIGRCLRISLAITSSEADARDAVQDAFVSAWRELPRLREPDQFDAWFGRILVNACRTVLRRRKTRSVREISMDREAVEGSLPFDWPVPAEQDRVADVDAIRRAFAHLRPDVRAIIALHHVDRQPVLAIAVLLGIPEGTVKSRLHEARKALERALEEER